MYHLFSTTCLNCVAARSYQCTRYRNIEGGNSQAGWSHAEDRNVDANPRFGGTLIRNQNTDSCKAYCDASPGCNGYVVTSARDCWLKALNLLGSERVTTGEWPTACVLPGTECFSTMCLISMDLCTLGRSTLFILVCRALISLPQVQKHQRT